MKKYCLFCFLLLLTSCAQSSGAMKTGPDTYSLSVHAAPARGGESGAKKLALGEANEYCGEMGKEIMVTNLSSGRSTHFPGGTVDVTFMCLSNGDSGLRRPNLQTVPDIVIENR